MLYENYLRTQA